MAENPESGPERAAVDGWGSAPWANTDSWLRLLMTVVYLIIFWLSLWLLGLAVVINLGVLIFTGKRNESVTDFARQLSSYQRQMALFASQARDRRPFPFGDPLPTADPGGQDVDQDASHEPGQAATHEPAAEAEPAPQATATSGKKRSKKKATRKKRKKKTGKRVTDNEPTVAQAGDSTGDSMAQTAEKTADQPNKQAADQAPSPELQSDPPSADGAPEAGDSRN